MSTESVHFPSQCENGVTLCTYILLHSQAQTFSCRNKKKLNLAFFVTVKAVCESIFRFLLAWYNKLSTKAVIGFKLTVWSHTIAVPHQTSGEKSKCYFWPHIQPWVTSSNVFSMSSVSPETLMFASGAKLTFKSNFSSNRAGCTAADLTYLPVKRGSGEEGRSLWKYWILAVVWQKYFHSVRWGHKWSYYRDLLMHSRLSFTHKTVVSGQKDAAGCNRNRNLTSSKT